MLKKINRGLKRRDFEESRLKGRLIQGKYWAISIINNQETITKKQTNSNDQSQNNQTKIGFVISKKISKRAVDRNRIKRLLSEAIRKQLDSFQLRVTSGKIIFLVKRNILEASLNDIELEIKRIFELSNK